MPSNRAKSAVHSSTEQQLLDALVRLKNGRPNDLKLQELAKTNRLNVNVSTVAREAGLSRTLIGHAGCRYPGARAAILQAKKIVGKAGEASKSIRENRGEIGALREAVRLRDSVNAALILRLADVEANADREIRKMARIQAHNGADVEHLAGRRFSSKLPLAAGNVVTLRDGETGRIDPTYICPKK